MVATANTEAPPVDRRRAAGRSRRAAIVTAAVRLFNERGYVTTSINDIGDAAGVTGPAIYRHFNSKAELLVETIMPIARTIDAGVRDVQDQYDDPAVLLRAGATVAVSTIVQHPLEMRVYWREARHIPAGVHARVLRAENRFRQQATGLVRQLQPRLDHATATLRTTMAFNVVKGFALEPPVTKLEARHIPAIVDAVMAVFLGQADD